MSIRQFVVRLLIILPSLVWAQSTPFLPSQLMVCGNPSQRACSGTTGCCPEGICCEGACCPQWATCLRASGTPMCCASSDPTKCGTRKNGPSGGAGSATISKRPGPGGSSCTKLSFCPKAGTKDGWSCYNGDSCGLEYGTCLPCSGTAQTLPNVNPPSGNGPSPGTGSQPENNPPSGSGLSPGSTESPPPPQENIPQAGSPGIGSSPGTTASPIPNAPAVTSSRAGMASLVETSFSLSSDLPSITISSGGTSTTASSSLTRPNPSNTNLGSGKNSAGSHRFGGLFDTEGWSFIALVASLNLVI